MHPSGCPDSDGVWTLDLRTWRPLHPGRLQEQVPALARGDLRGRGRFWLPGRASTVAAWDGGGGQLSIGAVGGWEGTEPSTRLVLTGLGAGLRNRVATAFDRAVITDAELARGSGWWARRDDGFDDWLGQRERAA